MTPKILKLFDDLEGDLRLMDLPAFANRVAHIKKSLVPLKRAPKITERFKLDIIDGFSASVLYFDSEKHLMTFMELKRKSRIPEIDKFCTANNLNRPILRYGKIADYKIESEKYLNTLKDAGLNLELTISRL